MHETPEDYLLNKLSKERTDLEEKIKRLRGYLDNRDGEEPAAPSAEYLWLTEGQYQAMIQYLACLSARIQILKEE